MAGKNYNVQLQDDVEEAFGVDEVPYSYNMRMRQSLQDIWIS